MEIKDCDYVVKILDFYYTRSDNGKLIQNTVFEYIDSNLEDLLQKNIKDNTIIPMIEIKNILY